MDRFLPFNKAVSKGRSSENIPAWRLDSAQSDSDRGKIIKFSKPKTITERLGTARPRVVMSRRPQTATCVMAPTFSS